MKFEFLVELFWKENFLRKKRNDYNLYMFVYISTSFDDFSLFFPVSMCKY